MKIAFITFEHPPFVQGGVGTYAKNITRGLAKLGNEVHVTAPRLKECASYEVKDGVLIHRVDFIDRPLLRAPSFWLGLRGTFRRIEQELAGFDIIHGNGTSDFSLGRGFTGKIPRVITVHHLARDVVDILRPSVFNRIRDVGGEVGLAPFIEGACIQRADKIIAVSEYTKAKLVSIYNVPCNKISVIYNGWEEKNFAFSQKEKDGVRDKYNIIKDKPIVLFVGRVDDKRKGLDILLRAFKIVLSKMDASLVVAGSGNRKPYKALLSSLGITSQVIFTGFVDNATLAKLYLICDIFVCPSRLEGFGLTILDAMAAGKPVVATKVGAIPEIVRDKENGFLVESDNKDELALAITQLLSNGSQAKTMGESNIKKVQEHYSWEISAQKVERLYSDLIKK